VLGIHNFIRRILRHVTLLIGLINIHDVYGFYRSIKTLNVFSRGCRDETVGEVSAGELCQSVCDQDIVVQNVTVNLNSF